MDYAVRIAIGLTALLMSHGAYAFDYNADCIGEHGRIDYHRDPVVRWACFDGGMKGSPEYDEARK
jgi:hypothetical protein